MCAKLYQMLSRIPPAEAKALEDELEELSLQQCESLQRAAYLNMSKVDAAEYDERHERIGEIRQLLRDFRPE